MAYTLFMANKSECNLCCDIEMNEKQKCWKQMKNIKLIYSNVVNAVGNQMVI